jgi:hypothetical protein
LKELYEYVNIVMWFMFKNKFYKLTTQDETTNCLL